MDCVQDFCIFRFDEELKGSSFAKTLLDLKSRASSVTDLKDLDENLFLGTQSIFFQGVGRYRAQGVGRPRAQGEDWCWRQHLVKVRGS